MIYMKKEGIVIIEENTIYEIDTDCLECQKRRKEKSDKAERKRKNYDSRYSKYTLDK